VQGDGTQVKCMNRDVGYADGIADAEMLELFHDAGLGIVDELSQPSDAKADS
jgi:hypothetical protein